MSPRPLWKGVPLARKSHAPAAPPSTTPPPWHTLGAQPLRLAAPRATRRAIKLPNAEEIEAQAKARRAAQRERERAVECEGLGARPVT